MCPHMCSRLSVYLYVHYTVPSQPSDAEIQQCAHLLRSNGSIVVLAGADVVSEGDHCVEALRNFVDTVECAVMCGMNSRGVYPESHPRWGLSPVPSRIAFSLRIPRES